MTGQEKGWPFNRSDSMGGFDCTSKKENYMYIVRSETISKLKWFYQAVEYSKQYPLYLVCYTL